MATAKVLPCRIAVYSNAGGSTVHQFATHEGLTIRSVPGVPLDELSVNATPTLVLVDRAGRVERVWVGILTSRQEIDLLRLAAGS